MKKLVFTHEFVNLSINITFVMVSTKFKLNLNKISKYLFNHPRGLALGNMKNRNASN